MGMMKWHYYWSASHPTVYSRISQQPLERAYPNLRHKLRLKLELRWENQTSNKCNISATSNTILHPNLKLKLMWTNQMLQILQNKTTFNGRHLKSNILVTTGRILSIYPSKNQVNLLLCHSQCWWFHVKISYVVKIVSFLSWNSF